MFRLVTVAVCLTCVCQLASAQNFSDKGLTAAMDTIREVSITPTWGSARDTVPHKIDWHFAATYKQPFPFRSLLLPATMIAYGATAIHNGTLQKVNGEVKEQIWEDNPHKAFHLDNYLMFAPTASVYALNA